MKRKHHRIRRYDDSVSIDGSLSFSDSEIPVDDYPSASADSKLAAKTASERTTKRLHVTFSDVQTRHYYRVLGDNPNTKVPLSLGWDVESTTLETVDEHDARVSGYKGDRTFQRLQRDEREALLRHAGYNMDQVQVEERRRRVLLLLEWTYRQNREESAVFGCLHGPTLFKRYIM